jgi:hypothetical protein
VFIDRERTRGGVDCGHLVFEETSIPSSKVSTVASDRPFILLSAVDPVIQRHLGNVAGDRCAGEGGPEQQQVLHFEILWSLAGRSGQQAGSPAHGLHSQTKDGGGSPIQGTRSEPDDGGAGTACPIDCQGRERLGETGIHSYLPGRDHETALDHPDADQELADRVLRPIEPFESGRHDLPSEVDEGDLPQ